MMKIRLFYPHVYSCVFSMREYGQTLPPIRAGRSGFRRFVNFFIGIKTDISLPVIRSKKTEWGFLLGIFFPEDPGHIIFQGDDLPP
jgi:hypothetical protein